MFVSGFALTDSTMVRSGLRVRPSAAGLFVPLVTEDSSLFLWLDVWAGCPAAE